MVLIEEQLLFVVVKGNGESAVGICWMGSNK
jgi:hypothetical protein